MAFDEDEGFDDYGYDDYGMSDSSEDDEELEMEMAWEEEQAAL